MVEDAHTPLGRWFDFNGSSSRRAQAAAANEQQYQSSSSMERGSGKGGLEEAKVRSDCFFALIGLTESLYVEVESSAKRDELVAGFRQLLFGSEGRARARARAHGRAQANGKASVFDANDALQAPSGTFNSPNGGGHRGGGGGGGSDGGSWERPSSSPGRMEFGGGPNGGNAHAGGGGVGANSEYVFRLFDQDGNGVLDRREAARALVWAGFARAENDVEALFRRFDANGNGLLEIEEFAHLMVACEHGNGSNDGHGGPSDQDIMDTFRRFDTGGDGSLDEFELGHALGSLGCVLDEQEVGRVLASADRNRDGRLDYGEFARIIKAAQ